MRQVTTTTVLLVAALGINLGAAPPAGAAERDGKVLPPAAKPHGWTLDDMADAVAIFSISGNDPAFYPDTPFQIIYRRPGNTYTVEPGTFFMSPLPKGTHAVTIRAVLDGVVALEAFGGPFAAEIHYTIVVE